MIADRGDAKEQRECQAITDSHRDTVALPTSRIVRGWWNRVVRCVASGRRKEGR
jgi:hypothetical protein